MIGQVVFAAATDESRPILTGIQARFQGNSLNFAAADGFRLSIRKATLDQPVETPLTVILPGKTLNELARVLGEDEGSVRLILPPGRNQVVFAMKDLTVVSQLIEGNFPDIQHIIPRTRNTRTVVQADELLKACKQADIFARESAHTARINVVPGTDLTPGRMTVTATAAETGDNVGEVDATVEGSPLEIAFNVRYLIDVLSVVGTDRVALETVSASSPGVLKPVGNEEFQHVIMPMHVGR
jgi:DNA polymerase-3 subunit beta